MKPLLEALPGLTDTALWRRYFKEAVKSIDLSSVLLPVQSFDEAEALFNTEKNRRYETLFGRSHPALKLPGALWSHSKEKAVIEKARELWAIKQAFGVNNLVLLVVVARSGQLFLMTNNYEPLEKVARINQWSELARKDGVTVEALTVSLKTKGSEFSLFDCSAIRVTGPATSSTETLLSRLRCRAASATVLANVFWFGPREFKTAPGFRNKFRGWQMVGGRELFSTVDGPALVIAPRDARMTWEQRNEDLSLWPSPGLILVGNRKLGTLQGPNRVTNALQNALSMATGVHVHPMHRLQLNEAQTVVTWFEHDGRPLQRLPHTGISRNAQGRRGNSYLQKAVAFLRQGNADYRVDALCRSIRHVCHAYEGRLLEQHLLSICLAIEELATSLMVHDVPQLRAEALKKFQNERAKRGLSARLPTQNEVVVQSMLGWNRWDEKIDYLRKKFRVRYARKAQVESIRLMRNGIVHAGRLLPNDRRALAALFRLEEFWHRVVWSMCGVRKPSLAVGRYR